jgi:uncharacterized protein YdhG (YjbR/CyaY superfamily)
MKKAKAGKRKTVAQRKAPPKNCDEYLAAVPQRGRAALKQIREAIRSAVPSEAIETISYRVPAFKHKKIIVWYAAFTDHCSLFPTAAIIDAFEKDLKGFSTSKGTIHFPIDKPVPTALIKKLVKARLAQLEKSRG